MIKLLKISYKILIERVFAKAKSKGFFKNPHVYFGITAAFLFAFLCFGCVSFASTNGLVGSNAFLNSFLRADAATEQDLALSQGNILTMETPDLKIVQDNALGGVSTIQVLTPKVMGDMLGTSEQNKKDVVEYSVQPGDTLQSIAQSFGISLNTLLWANSLTSSSTIKVGQTLVVLPTDGIIYVVKSGDTISALAQKYKSKAEDVVAFNNLPDAGDIYIGDVLILPNGVMPAKSTGPVHVQTQLADNFFIFPSYGRITQGLHYYNAVDLANKCGTPIYAAASGVVQRVKYGYNFGGGNYITILHAGNVVTYYGHLMTIFVKPGDKINVGDRIALMGGGTGTAGDGISTGCHLHFGVTGAKNPLAKYYVGSVISLK